MKQYVMRYKKGSAPMVTGLIEASSLARAEELGRQYCMERQGYRYIAVEDPVLVREWEVEPVAKPVMPGLQGTARVV